MHVPAKEEQLKIQTPNIEQHDPAPGLLHLEGELHHHRDRTESLRDLTVDQLRDRRQEILAALPTAGAYSDLHRELHNIEVELGGRAEEQERLDRIQARRAGWTADRHTLRCDGDVMSYDEKSEVASFLTTRAGRMLMAALLGEHKLDDDWMGFLRAISAEPRRMVR
jgi:hypothetical protein